MTIANSPAEDGGGEALAREAAHWFARMRSPDAEDSRSEFEAWLAEEPGHRSAYNRTSEIFAMGKLLGEPDGSVPPPAPIRRRGALAVAVATLAAFAIGVGGWGALHHSGTTPDRREAVAGKTDHGRISTIAGETRVARLADGSRVRLGNWTALDVDIGSSKRSLKLLRGRARFEVAHDQRPFIVFAGGGSVIARGTIFDVALTRFGKVEVRLLEGAIDVVLPGKPASTQRPIRKLVAGESISFALQAGAPAASAVPINVEAVPSAAAREFEGTPVAELLALANRGASRPIRLADASLAGHRVSGLFRIDDTEMLARRLGVLFGREVDTTRRGEIVLASIGEATSGPGAWGLRHRAPEDSRKPE